MKVIEIAAKRWTVRLMCDSRGNCPVLEFLMSGQVEKSLSKRMLAILKDYVPTEGPPKQNREISKPLRDGIHEFRRGPKKGKKLRVLYFYDKGQIIVGTHAFLKAERTKPGVIDQAIAQEREYMAAKKLGKIEVIKLEL